MLSSVPITLRGDQYSLVFTPEDVDLIETEQDAPLLRLILPDSMLRITRLGMFLNYGLKKPGEYGAHGEPVRALPLNGEGRKAAIELVRQYVQGKPATALTALANIIIKAISASWFIPVDSKEASASVPQAVDPSKNSEGPGSSQSSQ
jgi:hypothetical protein